MKERSIDKTVEPLLKKAKEDGVETAWDRLEKQLPQCGFGELGICCKNCSMGPCRIDPFGEGAQKGVCGATADTIAARNFIRMVAGGAAAHSDHGRGVAETLLAVANNEAPDYKVKDEQKLIAVALDFGIKIEGRSTEDILKEVANAVLAEFGNQEGEIRYLKKAPLKRQEVWRKKGIAPRGIDREIVEIMHRTHMGVDHDPEHLLLQGMRASLGDGWGGSMLATDVQDILFGTPEPTLGTANLGTLSEDEVNVVVHGHEPLLSEMIIEAASDKELLELAKSKGAKGINIVGMCCTGLEMLMRHGIPIAGNFLQQEFAIITGAVEAVVVDIQCIMPALANVAQCYHTKIISTSPIAKFPDTIYIEFHEENGLQMAKEIIKIAVENFPNRPPKVAIPKEKIEHISGFSYETINYLLGGLYRASVRPLNDNIINGRIRGIAGVVGCNNPKVKHDWVHLEMVKELIKNDVIVLQTGCSAIACAKAGLMLPEAAKKYAGAGLAEVCETVGIPPVLNMGSCVDNARILIAASAVVKEGGLGDDISDLPAAGAAPEWMSEKAISIGQYFVASGVFTVFGVTWPTLGAKETTGILFKKMEGIAGANFAYEPDPIKAAKLMITHIDKKRKALGIDKARERVLFDMSKRREL
ncbi:MAG: anaerobic carbon-monoxide dehydrogenase catalytic subunit [Candidatus Omnitrophica bacterium]|nr:anaerobic carbon-monoxide dehydrogenase catalytic subunit [Candidatus Omnitrophota bacterium]